jgi:uncharacterized protein with PhoU and TrkA domain
MPSLYRQYFTPDEIALLDNTPRDDLTSEINLLRVLLARVLEASQKAKELTLKQHAAILAAFSKAGTAIARLVRVQAELHNPLDDLMKAIEEGEHLARLRRGVYDYLKPSPAA